MLGESGGEGPDEETQSRCDLENLGHPIRENFMSRARYFGGSCNLWAGRSMLLEPIDFEKRDGVPGSGWPIPYAELAAYYPRAAELLGLPPLRFFEEQPYAGRMSADELQLFRSPVLRSTVSLWARRPKRFGSDYRRMARGSRQAHLLLHGSAVRIELHRDGACAEAVAVRTLGGGELLVRAKTFVIACGGLENARLLLASRDVQHTGIGNANDRVGRCFMDHPRAVFGKLRLRKDNRIPLLRGLPIKEGKVQFGLGFPPETLRREGLLNHYLTLEAEFSEYVAAKYQTFVQTMKVLLRRGYAGSRWKIGRSGLGQIPGMIYLITPKELMPHFAYRCYTTLRRALNPQAGGNTRVLVFFCEQPPDPESRVQLSTEKDGLGMNRIALHWRIGEEVGRSVLRLRQALAEAMRERGLGCLEEPKQEIAFSDASHHLGTPRMSAGPGEGVVDTQCRVHGVANLFMAGGSVFPTAGHSSPTLSIVALALRLAERLRTAPG